MRLLDYIAWQLDEAIKMLYSGKSKDEVACFLEEFKKGLFKPEEVIVDEDKTKYLTVDINEE